MVHPDPGSVQYVMPILFHHTSIPASVHRHKRSPCHVLVKGFHSFLVHLASSPLSEERHEAIIRKAPVLLKPSSPSLAGEPTEANVSGACAVLFVNFEHLSNQA